MGDEKADLIRAYKIVLRDALEARPSGIRLRIANTIGKNKSFISQITNPRYKTPLPEQYVDRILEVVRLTPRERDRFLEIYRRAHPGEDQASAERKEEGVTRVLRIELPKLGSRTLERKLDALLIEIAQDMSKLIDRK